MSTTKKTKRKRFKDPVHGYISLPDYCMEVVNTEEFHRLKHIKQLGGAYMVYPGATHDRFLHSCGVCHLAGKVIDSLKENQPDLKITRQEVVCVRLAGLCHDLGHGPLSHKFEYMVERLLPEKKWKHEKASECMVRSILEKIDKLDKDIDINLVCDLIRGKPPMDDEKRWNNYETRRFLYQIVANNDNGIDVDKWDYFARDCYFLGVTNSFDHDRVIPGMRVCECKRTDESGNIIKFMEISFERKLLRDLSQMFAVRWDLHDKAYQHRVVKLIEEMYSDVICEYFDAKLDKKAYPDFAEIAEVLDDMDKYRVLDDRILSIIARSTDPKLTHAREILKRIQERNLYQCIGEIRDADSDSKRVPDKKILQEWLPSILQDVKKHFKDNKPDVVIVNHKYDYGKGPENPLLHVHFFEEDEEEVGILLSEDEMPPTLPRKIQVRDLRLYSRTEIKPEKLQSVKESVTKKILELAKLPTHSTPNPQTPSNQVFSLSSLQKAKKRKTGTGSRGETSAAKRKILLDK